MPPLSSMERKSMKTPIGPRPPRRNSTISSNPAKTKSVSMPRTAAPSPASSPPSPSKPWAAIRKSSSRPVRIGSPQKLAAPNPSQQSSSQNTAMTRGEKRSFPRPMTPIHSQTPPKSKSFPVSKPSASTPFLRSKKAHGSLSPKTQKAVSSPATNTAGFTASPCPPSAQRTK